MQERKLSFLLVSTLLTVALGGWILTTALQRTIGEPEQAKALLNKSGIYQAVIPSQLAEAQKANPAMSGLALDNPQVQKVLATALDSKALENEGGKAVDNIYAWLEGKREQPFIAFDVQPNQTELSAKLSDFAAKHAATLPACAPGEDYSGFAADPLAATCLPPGVTAETVRSYVTQSVSGNPALAVSTQLNQEDVKLPNGKTIMDNFKEAPVWYQRAQLLPLIFGGAAVLFMLLLLLILKPVRGARSIGKNMLSVGITLAICAVILAWGMEKLYDVLIPRSDNPNIGEAIMRLTNLFDNALRDNIILLGGGTAVVGLVLFSIAWILGKFHRTATSSASRPATAPSQPFSLAKAPTIPSFTPRADVPSAPPLKKPSAKKKPAAKPPTKKPAARKKK